MTKNLIHNWGVNDADFAVFPIIEGKRVRHAAYEDWQHMIKRCYSPKVHAKRPSYIGCTVDDRWRSFVAFHQWREAYATEFGSVDDLALDKDLLIDGNKIYSPKTCCFVPWWLNTLFTDSGRARGDWPIGVCFYKNLNKFQAQLNIKGQRQHLGYFDTPEAAHESYVIAKAGYVLRLLDERPQPRPIHDAVVIRIGRMLEAMSV